MNLRIVASMQHTNDVISFAHSQSESGGAFHNSNRELLMTYNLPLDRGCLSGVDIVFTESHSEPNQVKYADFSDFAIQGSQDLATCPQTVNRWVGQALPEEMCEPPGLSSVSA